VLWIDTFMYSIDNERLLIVVSLRTFVGSVFLNVTKVA